MTKQEYEATIAELEARCAKYKAAMENALDNARESRTMPPSCANNVINHLEFALTEGWEHG